MRPTPDVVAKGRASLEAHRRWLAQRPAERGDLAAIHETLRELVAMVKAKSPAQLPFTCPVCAGRTEIADTTFSGTNYSVSTVPCPACKGAGVLWR